MNPNDVTTAIESAYTGGFEALISAIPSSNGVRGQFFDHGIVYDYTIDQSGIEYQENRSDSQYIADYYQGQLEASGIRCDSDNPYEYWKGRNMRIDARPVQCKGGGTPCGGRCLPRGQKCRQGANAATKKAMGGAGKAAVAAGGIAAVAAGIAGIAALAKKKGQSAEQKKAVPNNAAEALNTARNANKTSKSLSNDLDALKQKFSQASGQREQLIKLSKEMDDLEKELMSEEDEKKRSKDLSDLAAMKKKFLRGDASYAVRWQ